MLVTSAEFGGTMPMSARVKETEKVRGRMRKGKENNIAAMEKDGEESMEQKDGEEQI